MKRWLSTAPCEESGKHSHSASPPVQVISEQQMRKMLRLKAVTSVALNLEKGLERSCYLETCTPEQTTRK